MQLYFFTLKIFVFLLLTQPVFSQCTITSCTNPIILTGAANWVDGVEGSSNGILTISGITLGNIDCLAGSAGIEIYIYQLLPDGSRVSLCDVANETPDNFVFKYPLGIGPASDCSDTAFPLPDIQIFDHDNGGSGSATMNLCEGGVYEVIITAYVANETQTIVGEQSVFSFLNADQYVELNLGTFFVNYTNEFTTPDPHPNPITTAVITGPNGESGSMTASCGEDVSLFFEGLSYIGRCRFDEESVPNFYTFCDPSDPNMTEGTYSPSITSETETFLSYTVNGGTPVIIRNGNGGDIVTDAYGGQQTGSGNLPGLGDNECYTGVCGARAIPAPESICDGDVIVVTLQTLDVYTGNIVEDQMTITYSGEACNTCEPICPTEASIVASATEICSGGNITISGSTTGEDEATFTIVESSGAIAEINEGVEFTLPENNTCAPIIYTFNATAICADGGSEITGGILSTTVTVYPTDISAFLNTNDGDCSTSISVDASCGTNLTINPSENQTANSGESGTHNYTIIWSGEGSSCVSDLNLTAAYNCPPDIVCPSSADITVSSDQICSGESVTINGMISGEGNGTFTLTESTGTITEISEGTEFILPENNTCAPVTYTFNATAVCEDDGSDIPGGNLSLEVTVYPSDISAFVTSNDGECSTSISIDANCGTNISIAPSETQTANSGESGTHNYTANFTGGGPNCAAELNLTTNYNCPPDIVCPSSADITVSSDQICSGESVTINGMISGEGNGTFSLTESTGTITEISEGTEFILPENNTCAPVTYTFNATAVCEDDGSDIPGGNLSLVVTVYPTDISAFVTANDGECSTSITVDANCGTNISIAPSETQTANSGESGTHNYTANFTGGGPNCAAELNLTANYNCPPDIVCPSSADITVNNDQICSGESVTINGMISGEGNGTFSLTESTGTITEISEGTEFILPENNTCAAITYNFNATAVCEDDGSDIPGGNLSLEVTVYPTDISAFVTANDGECSTSITVDDSCGNNISVSPSESQMANSGETGIHNYNISWTGGGPNCVSNLPLTPAYNCVACPTEASISVSETEVCSGESVVITGTTLGEGTASLVITDESGAITEITKGVVFNMPANITCAPVIYTFTAVAVCDDDGSEIAGSSLSVDVTVYPTQIANFLSITKGECSTGAVIDPSCASNVNVAPSDSQSANAGESGTHEYAFSWTGGGPNCVPDETLLSNYDCPSNIICPAQVNISTAATEICSGEMITINGAVTGVGDATFTITESTGTITTIDEGLSFSLPENNTCSPINYTFNAIAFCTDDGSAITNGNLTLEVSVYPTDISAFVNSNDGACTTSISVDESCGTNIVISPSENQTANPGESGTHNYTISYANNLNCVDDINLTASYNCPPDLEELGAIAGNVGEDVNNDDSPDQPIEGVTMELYDASGNLVVTTTTDPNGDYTFTGLPAGSYVVVEVQPNPFSDVTEGDTTPDLTDSTTNPDQPLDNQLPATIAPGEIDDGNNFVEELLGSISGNVGEDIDNNDTADLPIPGVTINLLNNLGIVIATTVTDANGDYIFTDLPAGDYIVEEIQPPLYSDVTEGNPFPTPYPYGGPLDNLIPVPLGPGENSIRNDFVEELLGAISGNVGEDVDNDDQPEMSISGVTIELLDYFGSVIATTTTDGQGNYEFTDLPAGTYIIVEENPVVSNGNTYLNVTEGDAVQDDFVNDQTSYPDLILDNQLTATLNPGEIDTGNNFVETLAEVMACPASANITSNTTEICSGETVVISGIYEGDGAATYTILETTGTITGIESGIALNLPENNSCAPMVYTFELTATCLADGSLVAVEESSVSISVYPTDISSYISTVQNTCMTTVNLASICEDNVFVFPEGGQPAPPGSEAGTHTYAITWNGGSACEMNTEISVEYTCDCVFDPTLAAVDLVSGSANICFGDSIKYSAMYDEMDIDLGVDGGIDESYAAEFIIFIEPIDFNQPPQDEAALYRVTSETTLVNDESIPPGTYYIYYFQGLDTDNPIGDDATCKLFSQDFLEVEILPETPTEETNTCDCIFDPTLTEIELVGGSTEVCFGGTIEYKAKYDGIDRDLELEGGIDESYTAAFIIFIEPIDFVQPPTTADALYRVTNETTLTNDESIPPGTYYIYYFQSLNIDDPIGDDALCKLYSQDFLVVEILPEITSGETVCTGFNNANEVTISVADGGGTALPNEAYVENNGVQYAYSSVEVVDTTKILTFTNLPDGFYFFYYEDAQSCASTNLLAEFICESQANDCPTEVAIEAVPTAQCSGSTISLNANITGSSEFASLSWFDNSGNTIDDPASVSLPFNDGCDPFEITYIIEVACSQNPDFVTLSDMVTIMIYPTDISTFVTPLSNACAAGVAISDACTDGNISANNITVNAGESGTTDILVSYSANPCVEDFSISVTYNCPADAGCTDACAPNYDPNATANDNSCEPYDTTCNKDCAAGDLTIWDETTCSCISIETMEGCTDVQACNYNATANCEDESCQYAACNTDACAGDIEMLDPTDGCNCIVVETQKIGCDDPTALNYDATVNCADNSTCAYVDGAPPTISISELCYCDNEQNIDIDDDGTIDLVAEVITISGPANDTWTLTSNGMPAAVNEQNVALPTDGTLSIVESSVGVYTITLYHSANGDGFGTLTFNSALGNGSLQIANNEGCTCEAGTECVPPNTGNFICDE